MGNFKISVIIPCYNAVSYIDRCMESLLKQTIGFEQLEIILINDASTDDTLDHLKQYEQQYENNILIINCDQNGRQGTARNLGIQYSSSDYITFIDVDDWIEPDMLKTMYAKMISDDYDLVTSNFYRIIHDQKTIINEGAFPDHEETVTINSLLDRKNFFNKPLPCLGVWGTLYKRSLIVDNNIYFPEKVTYEDNYWGALLRFYLNKICILPDRFYNYYLNNNFSSTSTVQNSKHHFDRLKVELMKIQEYQSRGFFDLYHDEIEFDFLRLFYLNSIYVFATRLSYIPYDILNQMVSAIFNFFPNFMKNPHLNQFNAYEIQNLKILSGKPSGKDWDIIFDDLRS